MDIEKLAIEAGVIHVDESGTYWTDNNAIEVLENFARLLLEIPTAYEWRKNKD
jgi:hypothetical protein